MWRNGGRKRWKETVEENGGKRRGTKGSFGLELLDPTSVVVPIVIAAKTHHYHHLPTQCSHTVHYTVLEYVNLLGYWVGFANASLDKNTYG